MTAAFCCIVAAAHAQDWTRFTFGPVGDIITIDLFVTDEFPQLQVTDAFTSGDRFSVRLVDRAGTVDAFDCSEPTTIGDEIGTDYDAAFADDRWSSGEVYLDHRGPLSMEITVTASPFDAGGAAYRLTFGEPPCRVDLDEDGQLTIFDFLMFQNLFDAGDPLADFDGDGELTIFDFLAFQNEFDQGCE
ncbi:hypothetical protein AY599_28470 [Leptolyngbya valderiana BDU 20041]|nr:hypothetical protein AY599_28470 [Leptolyngbya valderiana BDU 20041]